MGGQTAYRLVRVPGSAADGGRVDGAEPATGPELWTPTPAPALTNAQHAVVDHTEGPLRVLGGPGAGKTTALVEAVVARIAEGVPPERVLLLAFDRRTAAGLRERIARRLGRTTTEPAARTWHSYAFAVLQRRAAAFDEPAPRLLTGPEQDRVVRELVLGDLEDDPRRWPKALHPALGTRGFVRELRDLLMRASERGIDAATLNRWGREYHRPDWQAAARFIRQYAAVTALADDIAYDPAELIRAVLDSFVSDPDFAHRESRRFSYLYVDAYAEADPAQEALLVRLAEGAEAVVVTGDPDQAVFGFRGGTTECLFRFPDRFARPDRVPPTVSLDHGWRAGPAMVSGWRRLNTRIRAGAWVKSYARTHPADPRLSGGGDRSANGATPSGERAATLPNGLDARAEPNIGVHANGTSAPDAQHPPRAGERPADSVEAHVLRSDSQQAAYVAHRMRQARLVDGVPWSRMAVLVRSTTRALPALRRALIAAGVPLVAHAEELPLVAQPAVRALLDVLRLAVRPEAFDESEATDLLLSPVGGADALAVHRLRRELRQVELAAGGTRGSEELLRLALESPGELMLVEGRAAEPALRVAGLVRLARETLEGGGDAEEVLWAVWAATGLADAWSADSRGGGRRGASADADLDAVVALFDAAARLVDRLPRSGPDALLDHLLGQQVPGDTLADRTPIQDAVTVATAHAAMGREWDLVAVVGVQEGSWPDLRPRGSLLGSELLVDLAAGLEPGPASRLAQLLDAERRLFYLACTRARSRLLVTAVADAEQEPSRFLDELAPHDAESARPITSVPRGLSLPAVVADLRATVTDARQPPMLRTAAAEQLARLAADGVPGANPDEWYGLADLSDDGPLSAPTELVRVSPSKVEQFDTCALRWLLESAGGAPATGAAQGLGMLVHDAATLTADPAMRTQQDLDARIDEGWSKLDLGGPWYAQKQRERAREMVRKLLAWIRENQRELVAVEEGFAVRIGNVELHGRVDRLERDADGQLVVVDLKTGGSAPTDADVVTNPQLGAYQLAVSSGGFARRGKSTGGAILVQLGTGTKSYREQRQPSLADAEDPDWAQRLVEEVAKGMAGSVFEASANDACMICPVRSSCPVQPEGGQVTE